MNPQYECIHFLTNTQFIRNVSIDQLLKNNNSSIDLSKYICYSVGIVDNHRIVNCITFLKQTPPNGVLSFEIKWYMPKNFHEYDHDENMEYDSVIFWVHSGVALRKKFFYSEDRMSFLRSTFLHDPETNSMYRLSCIWSWVSLYQVKPLGSLIYNQPGQFYVYRKKHNSKGENKSDRKFLDFKKACKRLLKSHNHSNYLNEKFPKFYTEIVKIVETHGCSTNYKYS